MMFNTMKFMLLLRKTGFGLGFIGGGLFMSAVVLWTEQAHAHDFKQGDLVIDHPYATPSLAGARNGAVYIKSLRNRGDVNDRLLGARSALVARVSLHAMQMDGEVMRMREVSAIELPAKTALQMGHAQPSGNATGYHLMLEDLKTPLKDGDRFDLTLRFEKAGERTLQIWVQTPRGTAAHSH
jgi:periplasmic copper chaperone A